MEKEVRITDYDVNDGGDDHRATELEAGLPDDDDLPPLSQLLISPELASAFNISPEHHRSMTDVTRASHKTLSTLRYRPKQHPVSKLDYNTSFSDDRGEEMVVEGEETLDLVLEGSDSRKSRRIDIAGAGSGTGADDSSATSAKRNRLVWTPQLHKRFVEVVAHLGVKNAVPKTIMQLMNVEGLTRENVASHLQKYRLYVKRMHSDHDSGCVNGNQNWHARVPVSTPYSGGGGGGYQYHHRFEYHSHPYNMMIQPK